jgi:hypothetical protein
MIAFCKTVLRNGEPVYIPASEIDKKKFDSFRLSCDDQQLVSMEIKKASSREYDMYQRNAHYFSYLRDVISNHEVGKKNGEFLCAFILPLESPEQQVQALHEQLKLKAVTACPTFLRVVKDKDGRDTYHHFSLRVNTKKTDPFVLTPKERKKYYDFVFDMLVKMQDHVSGWHIPPYRHVSGTFRRIRRNHDEV